LGLKKLEPDTWKTMFESVQNRMKTFIGEPCFGLFWLFWGAKKALDTPKKSFFVFDHLPARENR
jgi:hypothetical protein